MNQGQPQHQTVTDSQYARPTKATQSSAAPKQNLDSMLGNLQADMSRQGVNTSQKGCCSACDKPIVGQVITALGKTWHPEHFTCAHCTQELGTRNFFERDGKPYCEPDYHNLFSPRCAYCNGPILDVCGSQSLGRGGLWPVWLQKCVTALEKTWHMEHFFCAQCGKQFGEEGFHEREGKPYCRDDYFDMFAPKCGACNRAIMENYISALNAQWHPDCFVCRVSIIGGGRERGATGRWWVLKYQTIGLQVASSRKVVLCSRRQTGVPYVHREGGRRRRIKIKAFTLPLLYFKSCI